MARTLYALLASSFLALPVWAQEIDRSKIIQERLTNRGLTQSIEGALIYLSDTQIKVRPGRHSARYASCKNHGCFQMLPVNTELLRGLPGVPVWLPFGPLQNNEGEWANSIHLFAGEFGNRNGETLVSILDSNMFVTANLIYPLFLFRDESEEGAIGAMRAKAMASILTYQRGDGFNFWPPQPSAKGHHLTVKPYNVPLFKKNVEFESFFSRFLPADDPRRQWNSFFNNPTVNPWGAESLVNIPNDADDTALALAGAYLYENLASAPFALNEISQQSATFERMTEGFSRYRDEGARREDGRDRWKGGASGAFLTWLKEDTWGPEAFAHPERGVMPLGVNNVDCVVNSNVLFALGVRGAKDAPGFAGAEQLVIKAIHTKAWPKCGLYYPQNMIFPYTASRAYREGGIDDPQFEDAMAQLAQELIADQDALKSRVPSMAGAFSGGVDKSYHLSTALAVSALLNIGADLAERYGFLVRYQRALHDGIAYLVKQRIRQKVIFPQQTLVAKNDEGDTRGTRYGYRWQSGLFFSASYWDMAQWRSEAYTVAIVMEALTKYMLAYDLSHDSMLHGPKVTIRQQPYSVDDVNRSWLFTVD